MKIFHTYNIILALFHLLMVSGLVACSTQKVALEGVQGEYIGPGMRTFASNVQVASVNDTDLWDEHDYHSPLVQTDSVAGQTIESSLPVHLQLAYGELSPNLRMFSESPVSAAAYISWRFYQETYSRADGSTCQFAPTCSGFGLHAMRHDPIMGLPRTFGRLMRNHTDKSFYSSLGHRLSDPLSNYIFAFGDPLRDNFHRHKDISHAWYLHIQATRDIDWSDLRVQP